MGTFIAGWKRQMTSYVPALEGAVQLKLMDWPGPAMGETMPASPPTMLCGSSSPLVKLILSVSPGLAASDSTLNLLLSALSVTSRGPAAAAAPAGAGAAAALSATT